MSTKIVLYTALVFAMLKERFPFFVGAMAQNGDLVRSNLSSGIPAEVWPGLSLQDKAFVGAFWLDQLVSSDPSNGITIADFGYYDDSNVGNAYWINDEMCAAFMSYTSAITGIKAEIDAMQRTYPVK